MIGIGNGFPSSGEQSASDIGYDNASSFTCPMSRPLVSGSVFKYSGQTATVPRKRIYSFSSLTVVADVSPTGSRLIYANAMRIAENMNGTSITGNRLLKRP